jgi:probable rRNA maturation factor
VDVNSEGRRLPLSARTIRALGAFVLEREHARRALVSVSFVSRRQIARLNRDHLGHPGPTDVITFALGRAARGGAVVGDIYVAPEVVREQARRFGQSARLELARVVVHGILHALGRDHPDQDGRTTSPMWRRQEALLAMARRGGVL